MKYIAAFLVSIAICACNKAPKPTADSNIFSIKNFIQQTIRTNNKNTKYSKTVTVGDNAQTKIYKILDWEVEYLPFLQCDLHKSAWLDYISKDSTNHEVTYTIHKKSIPIKKMVLHYGDDSVESMKIWKSTTSIFLSNRTEMYIEKSGKSKIVQRQQVLFFKPKTISITIQPM